MGKRKKKQQQRVNQYRKLLYIIKKFGRVKVTFLSYCSQFNKWRPSRDRIVYANGKCIVKYYTWDVKDGQPIEYYNTHNPTFGPSCFAQYYGPKDADKTIKAMREHDSYNYKITGIKTGFKFNKEIPNENAHIDLSLLDRIANFGLRSLRSMDSWLDW